MFDQLFDVCFRGINIQEPCGAPAAPEEREHGPRLEAGLETRRTGADRAADRGESWGAEDTKLRITCSLKVFFLVSVHL